MRGNFAWRLALLATAFFLLGMGARPQEPPKPGNADVSQAAKSRPEAELLEFLADFQTAEGRFIDPMALGTLMPQIARGKDDD